MIPAPRFADRLDWAAVPPAVRERIGAGLGAPVVAAANRTGGFSPGFAGILTLADGRTVFAKAIGTDRNPVTPQLLRTERDLVPDDPAVPRLLLSLDLSTGPDDWVALVFEAAAGFTPTLPWRRDNALTVLAALRELSARLTAAVGPRRLSGLLAELRTAWPDAAAAGSPVVTGWVRDHLAELESLTAAAPDATGEPETLLHLDLRADNVLLDRCDGAVRFVDWPWACAGPAWVDAVLLGLDFAAYGDLVPETVLAEAGVHPPPDALRALLAALAGQWAVALAKPAQPGMGGIREFQRRFFDAAVVWLRRSLGSAE